MTRWSTNRVQGRSGQTRQRRGSRAAILRAAERIFAEKGLEGARTDAIAKAAGVNKALLYYYFQSKDELYLAILETHMKAFSEQANRVLDGEGPAGAVLLQYVNTHFDFLSARPNYPRLIQRFLMAPGRPIEQLAQKYFFPIGAKFQQVIERGIRSGELCECDSSHAAMSVVALNVFYFSAAPVLKAATQVDPYDGAQLARRKKEVLAFVRRALFKNPEVCPE